MRPVFRRDSAPGFVGVRVTSDDLEGNHERGDESEVVEQRVAMSRIFSRCSR